MATVSLSASRFEDVVGGMRLELDGEFLVGENGDTVLCASCTESVLAYVDYDGIWIDCDCDAGFIYARQDENEGLIILMR